MSKIWKMLKVFVSSTFLDLELERDQLNKVFDKVEKKILERQLTICPYDLRWRDRSKEEPVAKWCLRLLQSCDYFIGILGNRYGWRPPTGIDGEENKENISITEMEMRLALQKIPRSRRFFCFTEFDQKDEHAQDSESVEKLKQFLNQQGEKVFICKNMEDLLSKIENNISSIIDEEYPVGEKTTVIEDRSYRKSLQGIINEKVRKFCGRKEYLKDLHDFANSQNSPNYYGLSAVAGSGKSALMAKFICERAGTKIPIVAHFMGMARDTRHIQGIVKNLAEQLVIWDLMQPSTSSEIETLKKEVQKALMETKKHIILLIDGLDELSEKERNLNWLPQNLPGNVRVILTTRPVDTLDTLQKFPVLKVSELFPLRSDEIKEIIENFANDNQIAILDNDIDLLTKRAAGNPLYLKVALEELKASGLAVGQLALTIDALFEQIIKRLENQFFSKFKEAQLPASQIIQNYLGLIAAGENGILEKEVKEILNVGDDFTLAAKMALRNFLVERKNFLNFFHPEFELHIKMNLGKSGMRICHTRIAEYLQKKGYDYYRTLEELPYQLQWSENYEELLRVLTDIKFLQQKSISGMIPELRDDMYFALHGQVVKLRESSKFEVSQGVTVNRNTIHLLHRILSIDSQFLQRHPECTFQSFWNYGYWYDSPESEKHYQEKNNSDKTELYKLVEHWQKSIKSPWLQSKRPLPTHLNSAILNIFAHEQPITGIDINSYGDRIASGSYDNHLRIWTDTNEVLLEHEYEVPVNDVKFSPDGNLLYVANLQIDIWDTISNTKIETIGEFGKIILKLCLSYDGTLLAAAREKDVQLWDLQQKKVIATFTGHTSQISSLSISRDKKWLATGSYDQSMKIWDISSKVETYHYKSEGIVASIDFSPQNDSIAIATHTSLKIWNLSKQDITFDENLLMAPMSVSYSLDGTKLAVASQDILLYTVPDYKKISTFKGHDSIVNHLHFTPDGKRLLSGSMDKTVRLWDTESQGTHLSPIGHQFAISATILSPNGQWGVSCSYDQHAYFWDINTGILLNKCSPGVVCAVAIAPDNKTVAMATHDKKIHIWDQEQKTFITNFDAHSQPVITMAFNSNSEKLASTSDDLKIHIWNWRENICEVTLDGYEIRIVELIFKNNLIFSRSYVDERIWDLEQKKCIESKAKYQAYPNTGRHPISLDDGETQVRLPKKMLSFPLLLENTYSSNTYITGNSGNYMAILKIIQGE